MMLLLILNITLLPAVELDVLSDHNVAFTRRKTKFKRKIVNNANTQKTMYTKYTN